VDNKWNVLDFLLIDDTYGLFQDQTVVATYALGTQLTDVFWRLHSNNGINNGIFIGSPGHFAADSGFLEVGLAGLKVVASIRSPLASPTASWARYTSTLKLLAV
jgi:hypothetical protein